MVCDFSQFNIPDFQVPARENGSFSPLSYRYYKICEYCLRFRQESGRVVPETNEAIFNARQIDLCAQFFSTKSNRLIPPPFASKNNPSPAKVDRMSFIRPVVRAIDRVFMDLSTIRVPHEIEETIMQGSKEPPTRYKDYYTRSLERVVFGKYGGYKAMVNTMENVSGHKVVKLFAEYQRNVIGREGFGYVKKLVPQALERIELALGVSRYAGKIPFRYSPWFLQAGVTSMMSSAGIRPSTPVEGSTTSVKKIFVGKKVDQFAYYATKFHDFMLHMSKMRQMIPDFWENEKFETWNVIRLKNEFAFVYPPDDVESLKKLLEKCREFFIPNMMMQFLSRLLMTPRQKLERGKVIRIGQKWNFGGAQEFAEYMLAFGDDMVWFTGDFRKLDKSIRDWLLSLYVMSGMKYFDATKAPPGTQAFFLLRNLFLILAERINVKVVQHIGSFWTIMLGIMYSGGFETSHGDSWCVLFVWLLYFGHVVAQNPMYADDLTACLWVLIRIVVYGDDHVWCVPRRFAHFLNEFTFAEFVKEFLGMEIRDAKQLTNFFSTYNAAGELDVEGVVFLKRYFVLRQYVHEEGYPVVYPFKPTHETLLKLFTNKSNTKITYVSQAIGQAYDTLGTNEVSYNLTKTFYEHLVVAVGNPEIAIDTAIKTMDSVELKKMLKRTGLTVEELKKGFPTREMLLRRHKIDPKRASNEIFYEGYESLYGIDADDLSSQTAFAVADI
jgi:hypothetical protein